ncbi:MAG: GNAT family N-acetyltransferase [Chloroflexota bacterium]
MPASRRRRSTYGWRRAKSSIGERSNITVEVRGATPHDYPAIREILIDAFKNPDDEVGIWDVLVARDPSFTPDCARVTVVDGVPAALTVVLPRTIRVRTGWVAGSELTLVGCRTAMQGHGYGGLAVRDALAHVACRGEALAVFYGEPGYYPRFGCAPVFPPIRAHLPVGEHDAAAAASGRATVTSGAGLTKPAELVARIGEVRLEPATDADVPALLRLYEAGMCCYSGAMRRSAEPWEWRPRSDQWVVRLLPDRTAYAFTQISAERDELFVREAGAVDARSAQRLLAALVAEAIDHGLYQITAALPPDHLLHRAMSACGAETLRRPASPGFAAIVDWTQVMPDGYGVTPDGLVRAGRLMLRAGAIPLTQLALGYLDIDDLLLLPDCSVSGGPEVIEQLRRDFPRLTTRYSWAPFYQLR